MNNIFLDCGLYAGGALKDYVTRGVVDNTWKIYGFEPNPEWEHESQVASIPVDIEIIRKAVWIKDEDVTFWISGKSDGCHVDDTSYVARDHTVTVPAIDFSKFVAELPELSYIICSMDIEGSEYRVLDKMIADGTASRINELFIEFHDRFMPDKTEPDSQSLIDQLEALGMKVTLEVPLH